MRFLFHQRYVASKLRLNYFLPAELIHWWLPRPSTLFPHLKQTPRYQRNVYVQLKYVAIYPINCILPENLWASWNSSIMLPFRGIYSSLQWNAIAYFIQYPLNRFLNIIGIFSGEHSTWKYLLNPGIYFLLMNIPNYPFIGYIKWCYANRLSITVLKLSEPFELHISSENQGFTSILWEWRWKRKILILKGFIACVL